MTKEERELVDKLSDAYFKYGFITGKPCGKNTAEERKYYLDKIEELKKKIKVEK